MVRILVNGDPVHARDDATILEAIYEDKYASQQFDISIPTLEYLKGVQEKDDSGFSIVEVKGREGFVNAATKKVIDGMEVFTKTETVVGLQKTMLERILEKHDLDCKNCFRTGNCELQNLQWRFRTTKNKEDALYKKVPVDNSGIIVRDENKCVLCGRCVAACNNLQGIGAIEKTEEKIAPVGVEKLIDTKCVNCGQCITVCPVGALRARDDTDKVFDAIADPKKHVIIQAAPSVRASVGEYYGYPVGSGVEGKLAAALRKLGFDQVFDATFAADLTIMEEANEFIERVKEGGVLPMTTSCCPGWVKYCEQEYPDFLPHVSSCKSPQQMFGATVKSYYAKKMGIPKEDIMVVSTMPCTAKKFELTREDECGAGVPDVDIALTARELCRMFDRKGIPFMSLADEEFDSPLGEYSGAGVIFGATGGVMEAALRTAADWLTGESLAKVNYEAVRGVKGVKEATIKIGDQEIKVAAVSGLANAKELMDKVIAKEADYAFIEVMACPGGCVNGGGQPHQIASVRMTKDLRAQRASTLYGLDEGNAIRKAHDNPEIRQLYDEYLQTPGSEKAHQLLHTTYVKR